MTNSQIISMINIHCPLCGSKLSVTQEKKHIDIKAKQDVPYMMPSVTIMASEIRCKRCKAGFRKTCEAGVAISFHFQQLMNGFVLNCTEMIARKIKGRMLEQAGQKRRVNDNEECPCGSGMRYDLCCKGK